MEPQPSQAFWGISNTELLQQLGSSSQGLSRIEAKERLARFGANRFKTKTGTADALPLLLAQYKSPIILLLLFAAGLSFALREHTDGLIIMVIVLFSGFLGFWQERGASRAVAKLLAMVQIRAMVRREGQEYEVPVEEIVPGDLVILNAGDVIPGDCLLLEAKDLFVDEASLTGETFPVEKRAGVLPRETPLSSRSNSLFMGTHVISGTATALVVLTGTTTEFGQISAYLQLKAPETEFERGVRRFGYFLMEVTLLLVIAIFAVNVYLNRPVLDSFLFSLALAVGLTPQLLPAIISVNLALGARRMADEKVIVKRLASIENFGSMNILCADKTGTLTEGQVRINSALDVAGRESEKVLLHAFLNSIFETGFVNPIDEAIRNHYCPDIAGYQKLDEIPYDFVRKRLSVLVSQGGRSLLITKGALLNVLDVCTAAETGEGQVVELALVRPKVEEQFAEFSGQGLRTIGIAYRPLEGVAAISKEQEASMIFLGFLLLHDPPKSGIKDTIQKMKQLGVSLKIVTGDNALVATSVARQVGLAHPQALTGSELRQMSDEALLHQVNRVQVFAEVEPNQKERILSTVRKAGHVVGFMGDGINDASALHAADVSISVDSAVDVAKEAADIILLEKDLGVLVQGVQAGRVTFANTLKYIFMATSANFGNMFSMAGASLFLSFLPLLPKQILLTNLLTDLPEMTIATDRVDPKLVERPRRWNIRFIRRFMITFGLLSSLFDYATFGALLFLLRADTAQFRTGWFQESVISAAMIVLVIRTRKPFFRSLPGKYLLMATLLVVLATLCFPYTPLAQLFDFEPLPLEFIGVIVTILLLYTSGAEIAKHFFYRRVRY
jgi:Mg2+-importing ATPase